MIGTMQECGLAAGFGYNGSSVVTANVVKAAQDTVIAAHYNDGLIGDGSPTNCPGVFS